MISFIVPQQGKRTIRERIVRHCALIGGKRCSDDVVSMLALVSHSRLGLSQLDINQVIRDQTTPQRRDRLCSVVL
jgi:hypothetical protein